MGRGQSGLRQVREPARVQRLPRQAGTAGGRDARRPRTGRPRARSARRPIRRAAFTRCTPSRPHDEAMAGCGWNLRSRRDREARVDDRPGIRTTRPPSFSPSFSKSRLFCSKLFQRFLWRFCGISSGYKASKLTLMTSKFFGPRTPRRRERTVARSGGATAFGGLGRCPRQRGSSEVHEDTLALLMFFRKQNPAFIAFGGARWGGDAALPLQIVGIERALGDALVVARRIHAAHGKS
jgi:hypothetical protein